MSMLSDQIKELRQRASVLRQGDWSDGEDDALLLEEAAETIENLRDRLQAERTCEYIGDDVSGGCSVCRGWLDPACAYCPSCGAKVTHD